MAAGTDEPRFGETAGGSIGGLVVDVGGGGALTVGGREFSDASWVPFGLEKARLRKFRRGPFSTLLDIVFQGGLQGLHAAAQHAAKAADAGGVVPARIPPHSLAELSAGVPPTDELRRGAALLKIDHPGPALADETEVDVRDPATAAALKSYEDLACLIARDLVG